MRQTKRTGVFETNSSSVHSITVPKDGREPSKLEINKEGMIEVDFGQFGKERRLYTTQYEKLQYLITCLYYLSSFDYGDIYDNYLFELIQDAVCDYTGAKGIRLLCETEPEIDHQSQPYSDIEIINVYNSEEIIDFIFNKYTILKTDCD